MLAENYRDIPKDTFARRNTDGLIEVVSKTTGEVIAVQHSYTDFLKDNRESFAKHQLEDGTTIYFEKGLSLDKLRSRKSWAFSWVIADLIAQRILNGEKLTVICKDPEMPDYQTICRWRAENSEFNNMVDQAMRDAAQLCFDEVMNLVDTIVDEDTAKIAAAKAALLKWGAERSNPDKFAPKRSEIKFGAAVNLIIDTGVPEKKDNVLVAKDVTPVLEEKKG